MVPPFVLSLVFGAVLATGRPLLRERSPGEARAVRCTWSCHDHGCTHRARLPAVLTSDAGLFGATIRGLFAVGGHLAKDRRVGYGAANLGVFCVGWPALVHALFVVAVRQRVRLRALRETRRGTA